MDRLNDTKRKANDTGESRVESPPVAPEVSSAIFASSLLTDPSPWPQAIHPGGPFPPAAAAPNSAIGRAAARRASCIFASLPAAAGACPPHVLPPGDPIMNRLSARPAPPQHSAIASARAVRPAFKFAPRHDVPHTVLAPLHYEPNYAYPLIVWLHSPGGDEQELKRVMPLISLRNYVSLGVRGVSEQRRGFDWPQSPDAILAAESRIADAISQARGRFHIHSERIFLAGYASGGTMALRIVLRNPARYAAGASLGGQFPERHSPLVRLEQVRQTRLLISHCRDSLAYPIDRVCRELSLFHAAGMSVMLRQYPCGDELTTQMLHDLDVWLMEQVTGVASSDEPQAAPLPSDWN